MSNPRLQDITESEYQSWRHHPVTRLLVQYLDDYREALTRHAIAQWEGGSMILAEEHEMRARVLILREIGALPWAAIENFYQEGSEENAA